MALPIPAVGDRLRGAGEGAASPLPAQLDAMPMDARSPQAGTLISALEVLDADTWQQVRIEQRVIIRVAPLAISREAMAPMPLPLAETRMPLSSAMSVRVRERRAANCMSAAGIAAIQPVTDGRLLFHMRDRRMIAARLEKACSARDFYLGFYMSKTPDGMLCIKRDQIHSRAGTTCALKEVREFVPVER
ncbi:hypothetical protein [Novosphingobium sp. Chol11]|uniref:hypothetical protein n=1 Tax=Novosphingobium sp. Chol11 TaxID=1385763 RepID=UPI0025FD5F75|nr:hypothetical protein [Novosphingobium sp. Chol11]